MSIRNRNLHRDLTKGHIGHPRSLIHWGLVMALTCALLLASMASGAGLGVPTASATSHPAPTVSSLTPGAGTTAGGTSVVIAGTDLTDATAVTFGGVAATSFTVDSATQITAEAPAHAAGPVNVLVTAPGGTSANTAGVDGPSGGR